MTKEERDDAINCFKNKLENEVYCAKYNKLAIEALEAYSDGINEVLDKLKADIKENAHPIVRGVNTYELGITLYDIFQIIDKYKTESGE